MIITYCTAFTDYYKTRIVYLLTDYRYLYNAAEFCVSSRPEHGYVGLWNQGATCYLNSVLQTMWWDQDIRNSVFQQSNDENNSYFAELKRLFAQLQLSQQYALSTKPLTAAFGWKDGQSHEQHDAHELLSLLLDSMHSSTKELFEAKMKGLSLSLSFSLSLSLSFF